MNNIIGVIVGRFQVSNLHEGHLKLITTVYKIHKQVILFLGVSPLKGTVEDPLDFKTRAFMIKTLFPKINIFPINDCKSDIDWSVNLDKNISTLLIDDQEAILYGSRDSFIKSYHGKFDTSQLSTVDCFSGTELRTEDGTVIPATAEGRAGVIHSTQNRYINATPCIDVAIFNNARTKLLLGRKEDEVKFRFPGGHVDANESYEAAAEREVKEEAGIQIDEIEYITSLACDDWRHKNKLSGITTAFFSAVKLGTDSIEIPGDDIVELKWFDINGRNCITGDDIVNEHLVLLSSLKEIKY